MTEKKRDELEIYIQKQKKNISEIIAQEEERFSATVDRGLVLLNSEIEKIHKKIKHSKEEKLVSLCLDFFRL